jgi:hypothetical protein
MDWALRHDWLAERGVKCGSYEAFTGIALPFRLPFPAQVRRALESALLGGITVMKQTLQTHPYGGPYLRRIISPIRTVE